jgi:hypothetical protein
MLLEEIVKVMKAAGISLVRPENTPLFPAGEMQEKCHAGTAWHSIGAIIFR